MTTVKPLPALIVLCGPTASGKTDLGVALAQQFHGEVISADSRQIYRGMDIGTGKPEACNLENSECRINRIAHHLFNIVDPDKEFSVADFKVQATERIKDIQKRSKIPFLVGGTGLYIRSIVENLDIPKVPPNKKLREKFERDLTEDKPILGGRSSVIKKWYKKLLAIAPDAATLIDSQNPRRIIRALEIVMATGKSIAQSRKKGVPHFNLLQIGIDVERDELYRRIDARVDAMIETGLEKEVRTLVKKYPNFFSLTAAHSPGYAEWESYFKGSISYRDEIEKIKFHTHALARRQLTWFRRDKKIHWIKTGEEAKNLIKNFLPKETV